MTESLWPQLRLDGRDTNAKVQKYWKVFQETYVFDDAGERRIFVDRTGCQYRFSSHFNAFKHAFTEAKDHRTSSGIHNAGWSMKRLRRILWIREVLNHSAGTIQRYSQLKKSDRSNRQEKRRTLVVVDESYVVVFTDPKDRSKPKEFVTAFPASGDYIEKEIRQKGFLAETW